MCTQTDRSIVTNRGVKLQLSGLKVRLLKLHESFGNLIVLHKNLSILRPLNTFKTSFLNALACILHMNCIGQAASYYRCAPIWQNVNTKIS